MPQLEVLGILKLLKTGRAGALRKDQHLGKNSRTQTSEIAPPVKPGRGSTGVQLLSQEKRSTETTQMNKAPQIATNEKPDKIFSNEKAPANTNSVNLKIVTLNSQGRMLEECSKYMETKNVTFYASQRAKFLLIVSLGTKITYLSLART